MGEEGIKNVPQNSDVFYGRPLIFIIHLISGYQYRHADVRPWDPLNDMYQYERDYIICTKTKHKTPMIRTQSIVSVSEAAKKAASMAAASKEHRHRHRVVNQQPSSSKVEKVNGMSCE